MTNATNDNGGTEPRPQQALQVAQPNQLSSFIKISAKTAKELANLIRKQKLSINIAGREYVLAEGFALLARFEGLNIFAEAKTHKDGQVEISEAKAIIKNGNGIEVASATAKVSSDEPNWRGKPLYARESMAQTRAVAKALRLRYGFLIKLAGYEPTPAEEIIELKPQAQQLSQQQSTISQEQPQQQAQQQEQKPETKYIKRFWVILRKKLQGWQLNQSELDTIKTELLKKIANKEKLNELTTLEWAEVFKQLESTSAEELISFLPEQG